MPIKSRVRGPAPSGYSSFSCNIAVSLTYCSCLADPNTADIIDETLDLFRANSLFRNFEIKGPADRLLIILILFISDCLAKISASRTPPNQLEATKSLNTLAVDSFPLPGDANFALNAHYAPAGTRHDAGSNVALICNLLFDSLPLQIIYDNISHKLGKSLPHDSLIDSMRTGPGSLVNGGCLSPNDDL